MQINYGASQRATDIIAAMGRTEDLKFSPSNRLLAIAAYAKNKIAVFHINIDKLHDGTTRISLTDAFEFYSEHLNEPHGLDFLDEETIIVTNRSGDAIFFKLPLGEIGSNSFELTPLEAIRSGNGTLLHGPGSASIFRRDQNLYEALICSNYGDSVTRHLIDLSADCSVKSNDILLKKWLAVPDGVCISKDRHWIAVSNQKMRGVYLYEYTSSLNALSEPDGILRYVFSPHGVRFTSDGRFIVVADGGAPYVHIYAKNGSSWRGMYNPIRSLRVMNDEDFLRGRTNAHEGGPKGIDIDNDMNILAITCECRSLVFFNLKSIIGDTPVRSPDPREHQENYSDEQRTSEVRYELDLQAQLNREIEEIVKETAKIAEAQITNLKTRITNLKNSSSWRITAPLRRVSSALKNFGVH